MSLFEKFESALSVCRWLSAQSKWHLCVSCRWDVRCANCFIRLNKWGNGSTMCLNCWRCRNKKQVSWLNNNNSKHKHILCRSATMDVPLLHIFFISFGFCFTFNDHGIKWIACYMNLFFLHFVLAAFHRCSSFVSMVELAWARNTVSDSINNVLATGESGPIFGHVNFNTEQANNLNATSKLTLNRYRHRKWPI